MKRQSLKAAAKHVPEIFQANILSVGVPAERDLHVFQVLLWKLCQAPSTQ